MKISHNNHSYLSPSKLKSLATVTTLLSPSHPDDTYTPTDLDKLIIDKSEALTENCNEDETNDNILSTSPAYAEFPNSFRDYTLAGNNDNSFDYSHYNGSLDTDDALSTPKNPTTPLTPFRFSDYSDAPSTPRSLTTSTGSALKPATPDSLLARDFSPLNRIQNVDDLLSFTATTNTTTTSSTLNSWNEANSEFARKEIAQSASTRRPLLSTQNRFLSLSISPPLSRRQDMPVLRGTFVSLYVDICCLLAAGVLLVCGFFFGTQLWIYWTKTFAKKCDFCRKKQIQFAVWNF